MVARSELGPAQLMLAAAVARRYYLDGHSKLDIAGEFGMSRFKVARLLESARVSGLVHVEIRHPGAVDLELSRRLCERLGLTRALVVDTLDAEPLLLRQQVGRAGAQLVSEIVTAQDVLGLGWARSLVEMSGALTELASCPVVQLTGALAGEDAERGSSIDLVKDVARTGGGPAYYFYAPMIVADATTAAVLLRQPEVARAMQQAASVTKAVVGLGSWNPPSSTLWDAISPHERAQMTELGVQADVSGVLLDVDGAAVDSPLAQRLIGIDAEELHRIPDVIALAYGAEKAPAVRAAVEGGYVTTLVTHTHLAEALLASA